MQLTSARSFVAALCAVIVGTVSISSTCKALVESVALTGGEARNQVGAISGASSATVGGLLTYLNDNNDVWLGWTPWNLPPYAITDGSYTADGTPMAWYLPFLLTNFLGNGMCQ